MKHRQTSSTGCFPISREFEPVIALDYYMGAGPLNERFPYDSPSDKEPVIPVALTHAPESQVYRFSFAPVDWSSLPGEHRKTYQAVVDRTAPMVMLSVFGCVVDEAFTRREQAEWMTFQVNQGLTLPHEQEVTEFLQIFRAYCRHKASQQMH